MLDLFIYIAPPFVSDAGAASAINERMRQGSDAPSLIIAIAKSFSVPSLWTKEREIGYRHGC